MMRKTSIGGLLVAVCVCMVAVGSATAFTVPNPRGDRAEAQACGYVHSDGFWASSAATAPRHVCNPDGLMSLQEMLAVDDVIANQRHYFDVGVVVVKAMPQKFAIGRPREERIQRFAEIIHDAWGVGNVDGLGSVIVVAVEDRAMYISNGKGVAERITVDETKAAIDAMKPYLRESKFGDAVVTGFLKLTDDFLRYEKNAAANFGPAADEHFVVHAHASTSTSRQTTEPNAAAVVIPLLGIVFLLIFLVLVCDSQSNSSSSTSSSSENSRHREARREARREAEREAQREAERDVERRAERRAEREAEREAARRCARSPPAPPAPSAPPPPFYAETADYTAAAAPQAQVQAQVHHHHHHTKEVKETRTVNNNNNNGYDGGWGWGGRSSSWWNSAPRTVVVETAPPVVITRCGTCRRNTGSCACARVCDPPPPAATAKSSCNPCEKSAKLAAVTTALKKIEPPRARAIPEKTFEGGTHDDGNGAAGTW